MKRFFSVVTVLTLLIVFAPSCTKKQTTTTTVRLAPEISGTDIITGQPVALSNYRGKVVLINFWATWCPPCRQEIPDIVRLAATYSNQLQVIGVSVDQNMSDPIQFYKQMGMNYPVIMATSEMTAAYGGITGIPTSFVIDKNGAIANSFVGYRSYFQFENYVKPYFDSETN